MTRSSLIILCPFLLTLLLLFVSRNMADESEILLETLTTRPVIDIQGDFDHVQGIAVDDQSVWVTSVHRKNKTGSLQKFNRKTGQFLRNVFVQDEDRYHPGGITLSGNSIWLPVATYSRQGATMVECRDKETLELRNRFPVEDHIGCIAVSGDHIIGGNWDARIIYIWDLNGEILAKVVNPRDSHYQDMKWVNDLLVASGVSNGQGVIDWLTIPGLELQKRITGGKTDRGVNYMNEGMAIFGGLLFLLPEDGPASRLFTFELGVVNK